MALLDRIPGDLDLYVGGMFTLRRRDALKQANITHVVSVLRLPLDQNLFSPFKHMVIEVDDVEDEDLLSHFDEANQFIQEGLDSGGGVLVHCAMGRSRSCTVVAAFLMKTHKITPAEAIAHIRIARSICDPNSGFMNQLELYYKMEMPRDVESSPIYQRWVYQREIELSRACGQAPDADKIRFEDEHHQDGKPADFELRCRKCRQTLATSKYLVSHAPQGIEGDESGKPLSGSQSCSHYFLDPLAWMRPELEQGKLDGRLECPKCHTNVGKYAWQGMQCSCGDWIVPGISLAKGRIDESKVRGSVVSGIRQPPSVSHPATQGISSTGRL